MLLSPASSSTVGIRCYGVLQRVLPLASHSAVVHEQTRNITRIPKWEYHIRFDSTVGRKVPSRDVLERFKRLNNGLWIRNWPGKYKMRYLKSDDWRYKTMQAYTCTKEECEMLDAMMSPFWLRPKYYVDDPYEPYQSRRALSEPRMCHWNKRRVRERPKILLDDSTVDQYFHNR